MITSSIDCVGLGSSEPPRDALSNGLLQVLLHVDNGVLLEPKRLGLGLSQESQVENESDQVTLSSVVVLVVVVVNDVVRSVLQVGWEVQEVVEVLRVGQDVVAVHSLDGRRPVTLDGVQFLNHVLVEQVDSQLVLGVLVLLDRPVSVFVVQTLEEVVDVFLDVVLEVQLREDFENDFFQGLVEEENHDEDFPEQEVDARWGH